MVIRLLALALLLHSGETQRVIRLTDRGCIPDRIEIVAGETVAWENLTRVEHQILARPSRDFPLALFDSGSIDVGESYEYKFTEVGEHRFFCPIHNDLGGTVIVRPDR